MSSCSLVGHVPIQPQPRRFNRQQHSTLSHAARRPAPSGALRTIDRASRVVAQAKNPKPGSDAEAGPDHPELSREALDIAAAYVASLAGRRTAPLDSQNAASMASSSSSSSSGAVDCTGGGSGEAVPVEHPDTGPFPGVPSEPLEPSAVEPVAQSRPPLEPAGQVGKKGSSGKKVKPVPTTGAEEQAVYALEAAAVDALDAADEAADAAQDAGFQSGIASDSAVSDAADMVDGTAEAAKDLGKQANDAVDSAASDAADLADGAAEAAKDSGKQANDALDAAASDAADMADGAAEAAKDFGKQANDALETVASDAADVVGDTAKQAGDTLESAARDAADVAASVQSTVESAGQKVLDSAVGAANDAISGAAEVAGSVKAAAAAVEERAAKSSAAQSSVPVTAVPPPPIPSTPEAREAEVAATQKTLIGMLASLDRGAAASEDQAKRVEALAQQLERLSGPVVLSRVLPDGGGKSSMALLDGRWRLLYSSGFASGSLGGRRPGPSFGSGPFTLGQVYQDIMTEKLELDNVVDLFLRVSLAGLPGLNAAVPTAHARLKHTFSILGTNTVEITFTDTEVKLAGGLGGWLDLLPQFQLPSLPDALQPPKRSRSARFDVIFLDEQMRITRGDRGELRVFLKGET